MATPALPEALQAIASLLHGASANCWPMFDASLIERAKQSAIGQRILAKALGQSLAPRLFGQFDPALLQQHAAWLQMPRAALDQKILDLGALLFAGAIRSTVLRQPLQVLRAAIGEDRYNMILRTDLSALDQNWQNRAKLVFNAAIKIPETLESLLRSEGAQELVNMAALHCPVLADRIILEYDLLQAPGATRLSLALLQTHMPNLLVETVTPLTQANSPGPAQ